MIELASNDGYLLKNYVEHGVPVLGIDPARSGEGRREDRRADDARVLHDRAREETRGRRQAADVVHANNVMAHVADMNGFIAGIATILKDNGSLVTDRRT